ncbi:MAG: hypothetical protein H6Q89_5723 [Myxococcaceae bacterium]|nr:hypothetical protein [Myxococcaceae bacterium]
MIKPSVMRAALLLASFSMVVTGCRCGGSTTGAKNGEITIVFTEDGALKSQPNGIYNFGQVPMGKKETLKLTVKNTGNGALFLEKLEKESGESTTISGVGDPAPVTFLIDFAGKELGSGEVVEYLMTFDSATPSTSPPRSRTPGRSTRSPPSATSPATRATTRTSPSPPSRPRAR